MLGLEFKTSVKGGNIKKRQASRDRSNSLSSKTFSGIFNEIGAAMIYKS
jgi:hypothetical protein